jgi:transcriptional regulator with XRE-family HTH domain
VTISDRLKQLLAERKWSTRRFQEEVRDRAGEGTRGVSYASVWEYVEGRTDPPLSFLRVAAEVLGVREAWLASGEGPQTDKHAAEVHVASLVGAEVAAEVLGAMRGAFACDSPDGRWIETDAFTRAALVHAWRRRCDGLRWRGAPPASEAPESRDEEAVLDPRRVHVAREIGEALRGVLDALDLDANRMSQEVREDFVMGMVQAFTAVALVPGGRSDAEANPEGPVPEE